MPSRVENLYFAYLFVLRAVMKAGPILEAADFDTGMPEEDARTSALVRRLVNGTLVRQACPIPFDEGRLWKGEDSTQLRQALRASFQNITRIMDCVGCEKCKMWAKLQLLGIATSLKILFSAEDCGGNASDIAGGWAGGRAGGWVDGNEEACVGVWASVGGCSIANGHAG